ncbi:MAG: nucleoside hydrolase [Bacteroidetes bacterium]|nr:nucleoside hydrolase [Bacteroidota bacterium]
MTGTAAGQLNKFSDDNIIKPRIRVIIDNDFGGDPDGLFQLAHHILSPSVEIKGIIGSHIKPHGFFDAPESASNACREINKLLEVMSLGGKLSVYKGADSGLSDLKTPQISDGAKAIVKEAMREDNRPLYVVCGAGLTSIASAYLMEPKIGGRLTLIWIGGPEYPGLALPPPGNAGVEYNLYIDIKAAKVIFNSSNIPIWQVPRDAYRQAIVSYPELLLKIKSKGRTGKYLAKKIEDLMIKTPYYNLHLGETYILGDNPLVLLTALQSCYDADPSSSRYVIRPVLKINDAGLYEINSQGRNIRVYTDLDIRLMLDDFFAKLELYGANNDYR